MIVDSTLSTIIIQLRGLKTRIPKFYYSKGYVYGHFTVSIWTFKMENIRITWKFDSAMGENASMWTTHDTKDKVQCNFGVKM